MCWLPRFICKTDHIGRVLADLVGSAKACSTTSVDAREEHYMGFGTARAVYVTATLQV